MGAKPVIIPKGCVRIAQRFNVGRCVVIAIASRRVAVSSCVCRVSRPIRDYGFVATVTLKHWAILGRPPGPLLVEDSSNAASNTTRRGVRFALNGGCGFILDFHFSAVRLKLDSSMNTQQPPPIPVQVPPIIKTPPPVPVPSIDLRSIAGTEGKSIAELQQAVAAGGRFVVFQYCISVLILSFKRSSPIMFIPAGESAFAKGLPYSLISLLAGWWGIPWGPIWTIMTFAENCGGGKDVTAPILAALGCANVPPIAAPPPIDRKSVV